VPKSGYPALDKARAKLFATPPPTDTIISKRKIDIIINIPNHQKLNTQTDGYQIRRMAIDHHIALVSNAQQAQIMLQCLITQKDISLPARSWHEIIHNENPIQN